MAPAKSSLSIILTLLVLSAGCLSDSLDDSGVTSTEEVSGNLVIWSTYESDSKEEEAFLDSVSAWQKIHPEVEVEVTSKPFYQAVQAYKIAALGGEAPDLMRFSNDQLGSIAPVRDRGNPLLEDLRPWLTPAQRSVWDPIALESMRYDDALMAIPVSQDCVSLFFNRALFDEAGINYPDENWTTADFLSAAQDMTFGEQVGLSIPTKDPFRWFSLNSGYGGSLFTANGEANLDGNGSADALRFWLDLELKHEIVPTGTNVETMKQQFLSGKAAMIIDGPWHWPTYTAARLDVGQALLPIVEETGLRMSPMVGYKGWAVSKQSPNKETAISLALFLSSSEVVKNAALETMTMPVLSNLYDDPDIHSDVALRGFIAQARLGFPAPTSKGMSAIYDILPTAIENSYVGEMSTQAALTAANQELKEEMR